MTAVQNSVDRIASDCKVLLQSQVTKGLMTMQCRTQPPLPCQPVLLAPGHVCSTFAIKATAHFPFRKSFSKGNTRTCCFAATSDANTPPFDISILENYTERVPSELLLVHAAVDDEDDEVLIYKGHSSSLMRATPSDLEDVILPPNARIDGIDRMKGPYNPDNPLYIETGLSWEDFLRLSKSRGL
eukprot:c9401_g1_i1 orf=156-710(-)